MDSETWVGWFVNQIASSGIFFSLILAFGYIFRSAIENYVFERIKNKNALVVQDQQNSFEEKMNAIRTELNQRVQQQDRVLATALEVSSERAKLISQKEVAAVEAIWASAKRLDAGLLTAQAADMLKLETIAGASSSDRQHFREFAAAFSENFNSTDIKEADCQWARLFVTETSWALYEAYSVIIITGTIKMKAVEFGLSSIMELNMKALHEAILRALPHQKPTIEKYPDISNTLFLDELRRALISELRNSLHGKKETPEELRRATDILNALPKTAS